MAGGASATAAARPSEGKAAARAAASQNECMRSTASYPPGHPHRARLRRLLQDLGATRVGIAFEGRDSRYLLLSYRTEPVRRRLAEQPTQELKTFAMAQICQALPRSPGSDGKRGRFA